MKCKQENRILNILPKVGKKFLHTSKEKGQREMFKIMII